MERFDAVVVGARCAGSPLATYLARAGLRVCLLDAARFPSDTLSSHIFETGAIASLQRLGVLDAVLATGAPPIERIWCRLDNVDLSTSLRVDPGAPGAMLCVRRTALDALLVNAARGAGATVRTSTRLTAVSMRAGRVAGVRATSADGRSIDIEAPMVVGADGRSSRLASLVGARPYNVTGNGRMFYWAYYDAARYDPSELIFDRWDDEQVVGCAADAGVYMVIVGPPVTRVQTFRADLAGQFEAHVRKSDRVAAAVERARRLGKPRGAARLQGYFREAAGPNWALVGDAGHFKDPVVAQGIADALRQAEQLSGSIIEGLGGARPLDAALRAWWRERDRAHVQRYWLGYDLGRSGPVPRLVIELLRDLSATEHGRRDFWDLFTQRLQPADVMTPARLAAATWTQLREGPGRRTALAEAVSAMGDDIRRRFLARRPRYQTPVR